MNVPKNIYDMCSENQKPVKTNKANPLISLSLSHLSHLSQFSRANHVAIDVFMSQLSIYGRRRGTVEMPRFTGAVSIVSLVSLIKRKKIGAIQASFALPHAARNFLAKNTDK